MSFISGLANISAIRGKTAAMVAKRFGKSFSISTKVCGTPVTTYLKTGTQVARNVDGQGAKTIVLGEGNPLSKLFGRGAEITSYPKGSFFGGDNGMILLSGSKNGRFVPMERKEFGDFIKMLKSMANNK